jgi:hypothetical protein
MAESTDEPDRVAGPSASEDQQADDRELPMRLGTVPQQARKIRCMDDPEILERVLAGLLDLY